MQFAKYVLPSQIQVFCAVFIQKIPEYCQYLGRNVADKGEFEGIIRLYNGHCQIYQGFFE
jgi:hypothetical protein